MGQRQLAQLASSYVHNTHPHRWENQVWSFNRDVATIRSVAQEIFQLNHHGEALRSLAHIDLENSGVVVHELLYLVLNMSG